MDSPVAILFELLFSGAALAFGIWQLRQVRRLQRKSNDQPAASRSRPDDAGP